MINFANNILIFFQLEKRQMHERHQLANKQLKDIFFLQRHQMLVRHEKVGLLELSK